MANSVNHAEILQSDQAVQTYLKSRGFTNASRMMEAEVAKGAVTLQAQQNVLNLRKTVTALDYETSYNELREWVDGSLDLYKSELHALVYPMLVHCFLEIVRKGQVERAKAFLLKCRTEFMEGTAGRREELLSLGSIASELHIDENSTARLFLDNRYEIRLSRYACDLAVSFLHDDVGRSGLLKLLNQYCIVVRTEDSDMRSGGFAKNAADEAGFITAEEKSNLLKHDILWGRLRPDLYMIPDDHEKEIMDNENKERIENGKSDGPTAMTGVTPANGASGGAAAGISSSSSKKEGGGKDGKEIEPVEEARVLEDGTISSSRVPLKRYRPKQLGLVTEEDLKGRAFLGWQQRSLSTSGSGTETAEKSEEFVLPSVLCYTFMNTKGEGLNCSAVSSDGAQVAGGFGDSTIRLWDSRESGTAASNASNATNGGAGLGSRSARLVGHSGPVYSVSWTRCGRFLISGSEDGTVRLWSTLFKTDVVAYRGHNYPVWSVKFSPLDHYFVSAGHDRTARLWSTDRVYPLRIFSGHLADVDTVGWHPNCNYVGTGSSDRSARLWDVREGKCVRVFPARGTVHALAFSPEGSKIALSGDDANIDVWDMRYAKRAVRLKGYHKSTVWALDYSQEGAVLASGSADNSVVLWDAAKAAEKPMAVLQTKDTPVHALAFTRRNVLVACGNFGEGARARDANVLQ